MRATLNIPDNLIDEILKITGEKSKTKALIKVMEEYIRQKKISKLIELSGKIEVEDLTEELEIMELQEAENNAN
ncbi:MULTISPECIES: type II toxin-antitoxin system VapB family antitoxin [Thermodesulfovibrio]|uniref:type II toxin-antitoxin system VapB family antitoxin n=1 Tax=Thermodesulfovibrio TaxID=28261 RepID=UPI000413C30A|nr:MULTISPECIES: type II toxin-antitoxin system VapB family antitoxin [Thermodesulfovibrio]MBC7190331.1 type II toxin-antitoxin system VapB family antitoxin [Candidatus Aerophobetes bacterium]